MWNKIIDFFKGMLDEISKFLNPMARQIARSGGKLLLDVAAEAVRQAEANGGSGSDKFKQARNYVITQLKGRVPDLIENAVQGAILAAVASLKEK